MYTNHRHYILLVFALCAITISIFGYSFLRKTIMTQAIQSTQAAKEADLVTQKKQREQDVAAIYAKSVEQRAALNSFIVPQDKAVSLIEEIEKIGTDTKTALELSAIAYEDLTKIKDNKLGHFMAHVEANGSWTNIMRALILIENMPYNVTLNEIHLTQTSVSNSDEATVKEIGTSTPAKKAPPKNWRLSLDLRILTTK